MVVFTYLRLLFSNLISVNHYSFSAYQALIGEFDKRKISPHYLAHLVLCGGYRGSGVLDDQSVL